MPPAGRGARGAHGRRRSKGHGGGHEEGGSERWLVTYADMLTLLLVLFIVLFPISVVNTSKFILPVAAFIGMQSVSAQQTLRQFEPVNFSQVNITDSFWKPKIDKVATTTLQACIYQTEIKTPRIRNFEKVARKKGEKHEGL